MLNEYENWVSESLEEFKRTTPEEDKVKERVKIIKSKKIGIKRQEALYKMLRDYISPKTSVE